jgi:hypothetical protein
MVNTSSIDLSLSVIFRYGVGRILVVTSMRNRLENLRDLEIPSTGEIGSGDHRHNSKSVVDDNARLCENHSRLCFMSVTTDKELSLFCFQHFTQSHSMSFNEDPLSHKESDGSTNAADLYRFGTPISYPRSTSVELPSQPLLPPVEIMKRHAGSRKRCETTPVRCPGTIRKGTVERCVWGSLRS